jgi:hypothetical protein
MSAPDDFGFLANDNLPSRETIVALCQEAEYKCRGIPLRNQDSESIVAWVKYGGDVEMPEALTQDWVAKFLSTNPEAGVRVPRVYTAFWSDESGFRTGYIVMEYIDAPDCDEGDEQLVAGAVQTLISILCAWAGRWWSSYTHLLRGLDVSDHLRHSRRAAAAREWRKWAPIF